MVTKQVNDLALYCTQLIFFWNQHHLSAISYFVWKINLHNKDNAVNIQWWLQKGSVYIPFCLHPSLSTSLSVYIPFCLHPSLSTSLSVYIPLCLHPFLSTSLSVYIPFCLHPFLSTSLSVYTPFCLHPFSI